ncbi:catecholate siderophore receptor [Panacagrimonas perspica]|uniref:Catecholate siderophore receptor n=1 Tax=Panacagrimonas perspica TaxID=381431 RepID=A0A4S3K1M1_9GAMM|nr:catecholate siderophore receptor Fiu [Panacagrimonas perspica]TDU30996.1 catecholate siderophore receptor [Panacagrimonas perspica]THD01855.1 hypothetical protein B1810_17795 [Panacagrimonas perspica]
MTATFRRTPLAVALISTFSLPLVAYAQDTAPAAGTAPATQLPEVKVVDERDSENTYKPEQVESPKFMQPLVNTPQTVTVIRKEVIADQGALSLTDALRNTPGITFQAGENGNTASGDTIFMRGFDAQGSIFLDNIRDLTPAVRDVFNLEQVEIFKGPAGADNGRGNASGYINLVSKTPLAEDSRSMSVGYGTEDRRRISGDINERVGESLGLRLNLVAQDGGVAGRPQIDREMWGVAPSVTLGLGTATRLSLFSQHIRQDNTPDGGVSAIGVSGWRNTILEGANSTGEVVNPREVDSKNFYGLKSDFEDIRANMFTVRVEHDLTPAVVIRNTSRYSKTDQKRVLSAPLQAPIVSDANPTAGQPPVLRDDPDTWTVNRSRQASYRENELLTNQTNLQFRAIQTGPVTHDVSTGFELIHESQYTPTLAVVAGQTQVAANLYNPNPNDPGVQLARNGVYTDGSTNTGALYLFDTIKLGEAWQFTAGGRWERYETDTDSTALSTVANFPTLPAGTLVPTHAEDADNLFSWKTGVLFKPATNGSVYVAYANSLRPPGGDNFTLQAATTNAAGTPNANINAVGLDPQKAKNLELGTKWDFLGGRVAATLALFSSENKNDLARQSDDSVVQYGKKTAEGVEVGVVGQVTSAWQLSFGYTYQDTEVKDGARFVQANGDVLSPQDGVAINFSPKNFVNLWTTYKLPIPLTVGGGIRYVDSQGRTTALRTATAGGDGTITAANAGILKVEDYTVIDLMATYDITPMYSVQFNAYNVADEDYVASVNNSGQRYFPDIPASYMLSLNVKF